jgi:hypothetical protein
MEREVLNALFVVKKILKNQEQGKSLKVPQV